MTAATLARIALLGNPNCGKTALFNLLTGSRQKVANYAGVTVERKEGLLETPDGRRIQVLDLPGAYSLHALSEDESITRDVVQGTKAGEAKPDLLVCVTDATKLRLNLRLVLEAARLGMPTVLALNMSDVAERRGVTIDVPALERELGMPVVPTVAVRRGGADQLVRRIQEHLAGRTIATRTAVSAPGGDVSATQREVARILAATVREPADELAWDDAIDRVVLHPVWGLAILGATLFLMFQAVFAWAQWPIGWIRDGVEFASALLGAVLPGGILKSLVVDGIVAGTGSVLVFLPQILILFFFILALEDSGYLPRAAFLLDRLMGTVGLSGRSFIPLLSSFACAVPGIMATRHISSWRDRLTTIMIAPLTTCSARLPVYTLLIAAFIPERTVLGLLSLQGVVLFVLYVAGILSAGTVAWVIKAVARGRAVHPLLMELPSYRWPNVRNLAIGLLERAKIFLTRVGTIILSLSIVMWFLSTFPAPPAGAVGPAIQYSFAGMLGHALGPLLAPVGFNWQICIALVPGLAAREVAVSTLGTVYALSAGGTGELATAIAGSWSLATALALLAWYVFAPQCLATLSAVKRETNSLRYPLLMAAYLFALAYLAAFVTYRIALVLGAG